MTQRRKSQQGFTAMEAIVATFLFSILMASIVGVYNSTIQLNRRASSIRVVNEHARFISEGISKEIRNGSIDWEEPKPVNIASVCGGFPSVSPDYRISIVNVDGDRLCYYLGDINGLRSSTGQYLWLIKNDLDAVRLTSDQVRLLNFKVYVAPLTNPYCNNPPSCSIVGSSVQPRVTIVATLQSNLDRKTTVTIPMQTTINLPLYDIAGQ